MLTRTFLMVLHSHLSNPMDPNTVRSHYCLDGVHGLQQLQHNKYNMLDYLMIAARRLAYKALIARHTDRVAFHALYILH